MKKFIFSNEIFTKYDERDLKEILDPMQELKRALDDFGIDVYEELHFLSKRTIQAFFQKKRNVKVVNNQLVLSVKYEAYFRKMLDRSKALITEKEQLENAIQKVFLSTGYFLEKNVNYGLYVVEAAIKQCEKYIQYDLVDELEQLKKLKETLEERKWKIKNDKRASSSICDSSVEKAC